MPLPLGLLIMLAGWLLLFSRKRARAGRLAIFAGFLVLISFSYEAVADRLLRPLEYRYPPFSLENQDLQKGSIPWIVVLSGGDVPASSLPETSRISGASLFRLAEAARVHRLLPGSRVVISGGSVFSTRPEAEVIAGVAPLFGFKAEDLALEANSRDTEEQARFIAGIVGRDRCVLVTSASHMPRGHGPLQKSRHRARSGACGIPDQNGTRGQRESPRFPPQYGRPDQIGNRRSRVYRHALVKSARARLKATSLFLDNLFFPVLNSGLEILSFRRGFTFDGEPTRPNLRRRNPFKK